MEGNRNGVAASEVDDVAVFEITLVDLLVVDVGPVRGVAIDEKDLSVDRDDLGVEPRDLRILQYDLTNCRFAPDADARAAEPEALAGARAVEDRELAEDRGGAAAGRGDPRLRGRAHAELLRRASPRDRNQDGDAGAEQRDDERAARHRMLPPQR